MTENENDKENEGQRTQVKLLLLLAAVTVCLVLVVLLYMAWNRIEALEEQQAGLQQQQKQFVEQASGKLGTILQQQRQQLKAALQQQAEILKQLQLELQQIRQRVSRDHNGWLLAEAGYLLKIAQQRLLLHRDTASAIVAMQMAAARIRSINRPELKPLLELTEKEIKLLQAVKPDGLEDVLAELLKAEQAVDDLALKSVKTFRRKQAATKKDDDGFFASLWNQLKTLVVIRRHDRKYQPILTQQEQHQVRQVLKLKLAQARTALANGQADYFRKLLADMRRWLQQYFSETDKNVVAMNKMLLALEKRPARQAMPETGKALQWLQLFNARKATSKAPAAKVPAGKTTVNKTAAPAGKPVNKAVGK